MFLLVILFVMPVNSKAQSWSDWLLSFFIAEDFPKIENTQFIVGEGGIALEERDLPYFNSINLHESMNLILQNSTSGQCIIESDALILPAIKTQVKNKTLWIYPTQHFYAEHQPLILICTSNVKYLKSAQSSLLRLGSGSFTFLGSYSPKYQEVEIEMESGDALYVLTSKIQEEANRLEKYLISADS
jgi:hypothetical protein